MIKIEELEKIVNEAIDGHKYVFLVALKLISEKKIYLEIDGDQPVSIGVCTSIYKKIRAVIQEQSDDFMLEVTTPNIDKPIVNNRQYNKNVGKILQLILADDSIVEGLLLDVNETGLLLEIHKDLTKSKKDIKVLENKISISFREIKQSKVVLKFNK